MADDWLQFREVVTSAWLGHKHPAALVNMAKEMLQRTLEALFDGRASIQRLCEQRAGFAPRFAAALHASTPWARRTRGRVLHVLRAILSRTTVDPALIRATRLPSKPRVWNLVFGKKNAANSEHLEQWRKRLVHLRSPMSQRTFFIFLLSRVLPAIGVTDVSRTDEVRRQAERALSNADTVLQLCTGKSAGRKLHRLQVFLRDVLDSEMVLPETLRARVKRCARVEEEQEDEDPERHRISKQDLETLYATAREDSFNELFFLLLLTTGMRGTGFVKLRCEGAATLDSDGMWHARAEGWTLEKGHKIFHFKLHPRVRVLLEDWLNNRRCVTASSPYAFPGATRPHITTHMLSARFKRMCKQANLPGRQFHLHALRHCFSRTLLDLGHSLEVVARLMNHTNVSTTERYYLKESAAHTASRARIPWFDHEEDKRYLEPPDPVPNFLKAPSCLPASLLTSSPASSPASRITNLLAFASKVRNAS